MATTTFFDQHDPGLNHQRPQFQETTMLHSVQQGGSSFSSIENENSVNEKINEAKRSNTERFALSRKFGILYVTKKCLFLSLTKIFAAAFQRFSIAHFQNILEERRWREKYISSNLTNVIPLLVVHISWDCQRNHGTSSTQKASSRKVYDPGKVFILITITMLIDTTCWFLRDFACWLILIDDFLLIPFQWNLLMIYCWFFANCYLLLISSWFCLLIAFPWRLTKFMYLVIFYILIIPPTAF